VAFVLCRDPKCHPGGSHPSTGDDLWSGSWGIKETLGLSFPPGLILHTSSSLAWLAWGGPGFPDLLPVLSVTRWLLPRCPGSLVPHFHVHCVPCPP
jgi:hypothetical protein